MEKKQINQQKIIENQADQIEELLDRNIEIKKKV